MLDSTEPSGFFYGMPEMSISRNIDGTNARGSSLFAQDSLFRKAPQTEISLENGDGESPDSVSVKSIRK